jgi:hypothetical protein
MKEGNVRTKQKKNENGRAEQKKKIKPKEETKYRKGRKQKRSGEWKK